MATSSVARTIRASLRAAQASIVLSALAVTTAATLVVRAILGIYMESSTFSGLVGVMLVLPPIAFILALAAKKLSHKRSEPLGFVRIAFIFSFVGLALFDLPFALMLMFPSDATVRVIT